LTHTAEGLVVNRGSAANGPCQQDLMWRLRGVSEECRAGCCPHSGAGRGDGCPGDLPGAPLPERVVHLRGCRLLTVQKIAALTGADRELITRLLYEDAGGGAARGPARRMSVRTTEDERLDQALARMAQEDQLPCPRAAPPSRRGPSEAELLIALYADPGVRQVLDRHGIPVLTLSGTPWRRFPAPRPLTAPLVGRPAAAAGARLRASGIKLRPPGGRSPFTDRWRPAKDDPPAPVRGALTSCAAVPNEFLTLDPA
jgi:hypothetical protein